MKSSRSFNQLVRSTGITLSVAIAVSIAILVSSPTDSGQRGFGYGAVKAACCLDLLWIAAALLVATKKQFLPKYFWSIFITNATAGILIVGLIWVR